MLLDELVSRTTIVFFGYVNYFVCCFKNVFCSVKLAEWFFTEVMGVGVVMLSPLRLVMDYYIYQGC